MIKVSKNSYAGKTSLLLFFVFTITTTFAQKDAKQISLEYTGYIKNGQYHEAYALLDTSLTPKISEDNFKAIFQGVVGKLGSLEDFSFNKQKNEAGVIATYVLCHFQNATLNLQIVFSPSLRITGIHFLRADESASQYTPPAYDSSKLYTEKQITVSTGEYYRMPGILTIPKHVKNPPVIIFVHGSGPEDKDESVGANKTFRDLAVGLAAKGIATIRYDKRTYIYGRLISSKPHNATVKEESIDDALSAVNMVGKLSSLNTDSNASGIHSLGLDSNRVYVLGHSLGAMLAPRIANESKKIKGIIMMAGNARSLPDVMIEQYKYRASLDTTGGDKTKQAVEIEIKKAELAESPDLKPDTPDSLLPYNSPAPYWIDLNHYNQVKMAEKLTIPIFILQGENDCQVSMKDYDLWKEKLGNKKNVTLKSYPKLNHLFIEYDGKSTGAEYEKPGNVPFYIVTDIASWVNTK